jgi:hypothetical protein
VNGFRSLAQNTTERNVIVWINEYFGRVERAGKTFPDMAAYIENADKVLGSVHIPRRNPGLSELAAPRRMEGMAECE